MRQQQEWRRYAAPAAFLLAVTVAVVLVRSGLEHNSSNPRTTTTRRIPPSPQVSTTANKREYWRVRAGDTFGVISSKTGVPVARIQRLNPKVTSTSLFIGEKVRIK
ncbi:MAG: LysM peptidoglycan-binding domain-containing protein [Gaiellaceae bacterium]